jgi:hypothetical protein
MEKLFCRTCAEEAFKTWKGWPPNKGEVPSQLTTVPRLPSRRHCACRKCGGTSSVPASYIRYINIHGEYNTGLPDYFALMICEPGNEHYDFLSQWGDPYSLTEVPSTTSNRPPGSKRPHLYTSHLESLTPRIRHQSNSRWTLICRPLASPSNPDNSLEVSMLFLFRLRQA